MGASSIAPIVVPQVLQKALLEYEDERHVDGFPPAPVHSTLGAGNSTQESVNEPECLRQLMHEQVWGLPGAPVARNLIAPHKQPPSYWWVFIFGDLRVETN